MLDLTDFTYLDPWGNGIEVCINPQVDTNKFSMINQGKGVEINKLTPAQKWLDENYPLAGVCQLKEKKFLFVKSFSLCKLTPRDHNVSLLPNRNYGKERSQTI